MAYKINPNDMYKLVIVLVLFLAAQLGFAQSITPEVVATSGDHYSANGIQLSWTVGEATIETYESNDNFITQGFHQTELLITEIDELNPTNVQVSLYPNPTADFLIITIAENENDLEMVLFDVNGKRLRSDKISGNQMTVDMTGLANAYYVVRLQSKAIGYSSTHKVQKTEN